MESCWEELTGLVIRSGETANVSSWFNEGSFDSPERLRLLDCVKRVSTCCTSMSSLSLFAEDDRKPELGLTGGFSVWLGDVNVTRCLRNCRSSEVGEGRVKRIRCAFFEYVARFFFLGDDKNILP